MQQFLDLFIIGWTSVAKNESIDNACETRRAPLQWLLLAFYSYRLILRIFKSDKSKRDFVSVTLNRIDV